MELKVLKPFDWAHKGVRVESFSKDQVISTDDQDLIRVATDEKWVSRVRGGEQKGQAAAPENKALTGATESKEAAGSASGASTTDGGEAID